MRRGEGIAIGAGLNNAIRLDSDFLHGFSGYDICMYMYLYAYVYVYVCVYICIYVYIYIYMMYIIFWV